MNKVDPDTLSQLALMIMRPLVEFPNELRFEAYRMASGRIMVVAPGKHRKSDHARLIGKLGIHFVALQRLLQAAAVDEPLALKIDEPEGVPVWPGPPTPEDTGWTADRDEAFLATFTEVVHRVLGNRLPVRVNSVGNTTQFIMEARIHPGLVNAFDTLWRAIGRNHGRKFRVFCEDAKEKAA